MLKQWDYKSFTDLNLMVTDLVPLAEQKRNYKTNDNVNLKASQFYTLSLKPNNRYCSTNAT